MIGEKLKTSLAVFTLAMATLNVSAAAAETKLLFSTFFPMTHPLVADVLKPWADAVEEETKGEVVIEFSAASLAPPPEQLDMVQNGVADITVQYSSVVPNRLTSLMMTELPNPHKTTDVTSVALWRTYEKYFSVADEMKGVKLLSLFTLAPQALFSLSETPPQSVEELKALKLATTPGMAATAWGSITPGVVAGPAFRYFEVVSKGMVDAYVAFTPIEVISFNLSRYTKSIAGLGELTTAGSFALVMNERAWRRLSEENRAALESLSGEAFSRRLAAVEAANNRVIEDLKKDGVVFSTISDEFSADLGEAFQFLQEDWIQKVSDKGIDGAAAIEYYRDLLKSL